MYFPKTVVVGPGIRSPAHLGLVEHMFGKAVHLVSNGFFLFDMLDN